MFLSTWLPTPDPLCRRQKKTWQQTGSSAATLTGLQSDAPLCGDNLVIPCFCPDTTSVTPLCFCIMLHLWLWQTSFSKSLEKNIPLKNYLPFWILWLFETRERSWWVCAHVETPKAVTNLWRRAAVSKAHVTCCPDIPWLMNLLPFRKHFSRFSKQPRISHFLPSKMIYY